MAKMLPSIETVVIAWFLSVTLFKNMYLRGKLKLIQCSTRMIFPCSSPCRVLDDQVQHCWPSCFAHWLLTAFSSPLPSDHSMLSWLSVSDPGLTHIPGKHLLVFFTTFCRTNVMGYMLVRSGLHYRILQTDSTEVNFPTVLKAENPKSGCAQVF